MAFKIAKISVDKVVEQLEIEFGRDAAAGRLHLPIDRAPRPIAYGHANSNERFPIRDVRKRC